MHYGISPLDPTRAYNPKASGSYEGIFVGKLLSKSYVAFKRVSCKGAIDTLQSISCRAAHAPVLMIPPMASHPE